MKSSIRLADAQPDFWCFLKGLLQAKNRQIASLQANAYAARNSLYLHQQNAPAATRVIE